MAWHGVYEVKREQYSCGFCDNMVASTLGLEYRSSIPWFIRICPYCERPTYFSGDDQTPGVVPGNDVETVPTDIDSLYKESRHCIGSGCNTAAVLLARKLLMHIAVAQGAEKNLTFIKYVEYLAERGYVPPNGTGWVDHIRKKGNEANHEIQLMSTTDATELILFVEMLLKFVYEFPNRIPVTA